MQIQKTVQVLTFEQCAGRAGYSLRHFERLLSRGEGPAVVKLGVRRRGVLESDMDAWILARRQPAPSQSTAA
jgi:predicted DNA-binding transcriptional regulator AlpA